MAAGLLLLLLRASSGLRQTLSELVSHLLCVLHPNQVYNVKKLASRTLEQAFVGTLAAQAVYKAGTTDRSSLY
jgi:hypothetical protein